MNPEARRVAALLRRGWPYRKIAPHLGVSVKTLQRLVDEHDLNVPPTGYVFVQDTLEQLAVHTVPGAHLALTRGGLTLERWGGRRMVAERELHALLARRDPTQRVSTPPPGYVSAAALAQAHRMHPGTIYARLRRLGVTPRLYMDRPHGRGGALALYSLREADAVLPRPSAPFHAPPGYLTTLEVAAVCGVTIRAVQAWAQRGAPFLRGSGEGRPCLFWPAHLIAWLEGRPTHVSRHHAARLSAHVTQRRAA